MLDRRKKLLFRILQKIEMVVAFTYGQLPPRILVVVELGSISSQFKTFFQIVFNIKEVLED